MHTLLNRVYVALAVCCCTLFSINVQAQVNIVENDTTICPGQNIVLHAVNGSGIPASASLNQDDIYSGIIPIGFSFTFYGIPYTQCVISTNGFVSFNTFNAGGTSNWNLNTGGAIPGNSDCLNSIMAHFADIYPGTTTADGSIDYAVTGTAPNRKFLVTFCDVRMYNCTTLKTSFQIILCETTNIIEIHLREKPVCGTWPTVNPGVAIEGLQNASGTIAHPVAGRNFPTIWTANRSSHRFTPTGASTYLIDTIPYAAIPTTGNNAIQWTNGAGAVIGTGPTITVTPTSSPSVYYAQQYYCSDTTRDSIHVIIGGQPHIDSIQKQDPSYCGASDGSLTLFGVPPNTSLVVKYTRNSVLQPTFTTLSSPNGRVVINNLPADYYTGISVTAGVCVSNIMPGAYILVNPSITVDFTSANSFACTNDTVRFTNLTSTPGTIHYNWEFGDGTGDTTTNPTHIYGAQGQYNVLLIATNGICRDSISKVIDTRHPLVASFTVDHDSACQRQLVTFTSTSVSTIVNGITPTYLWDFGDGTSSTQPTPTHDYQLVGTYTARLVIFDGVPCSDTSYHTIVIDSIPTSTFVTNINSLCEGQNIVFTADFHSNPPKNFSWAFGDGAISPNVNPVNHAFDTSGTFTVRLTTQYRLCPDTFFEQSVTVRPFPGINLGTDTTICPGGAPIALSDHANLGNPAATYLWTTGATTQSILVNQDGIYSATVTVDGCSATDSVTVFKDCYLDIPNTFTPNGDGLNDYFFPREFLSLGVTSFKMGVYNRWGQIIFETTNTDGRGWDGRFNDAMQPTGVYIYIMDVVFKNGNTEHHTGNITLLQ